jgi:hypothetical protein
LKGEKQIVVRDANPSLRMLMRRQIVWRNGEPGSVPVSIQLLMNEMRIGHSFRELDQAFLDEFIGLETGECPRSALVVHELSPSFRDKRKIWEEFGSESAEITFNEFRFALSVFTRTQVRAGMNNFVFFLRGKSGRLLAVKARVLCGRWEIVTEKFSKEESKLLLANLIVTRER